MNYRGKVACQSGLCNARSFNPRERRELMHVVAVRFSNEACKAGAAPDMKIGSLSR